MSGSAAQLPYVTPGSISFSPAKIQGLGDSMTGNTNWFPSEQSLASVPVWTANTVYAANSVVQRAGLVFFTTAGGTSSTTGPSPSNLTDGTVIWVWNESGALKTLNAFLPWVEMFSNGRVTWDMYTGYTGIGFGITGLRVISGGSGYSVATTINLNNGAKATPIITAGVITGATITSCGYGAGGGFSCTVSDSGGGSGAVIQPLGPSTGCFGAVGGTTATMINYLPDVVMSDADFVTVLGGTNDVGNLTITQTTANLKTIYETLMAAGKKVVAIPPTPTTIGASASKSGYLLAVGRWIRAYCRGETWANPLKYRNIILADVSPYWTDATVNSNYQPVGGSGSVAGAMTADGLHPSNRGAAYIGYVIWQAIETFVGAAPARSLQSYTAADGYDPTYNPGGNCLEGLPWQASTVYALGAICSNGGLIYYVTTAGTSAASGGPTGFTTSVDGGVTWTYVGEGAGRSNFSSGTAGGKTGATGVTYTGNLASGYYISRITGSASGSITLAIENPWSDGQPGNRQSIAFSLGSGANNESWTLQLDPLANAKYGILPADLGVTKFYLEAEIVLSNIVNVEGFELNLQGDRFYSQVGSANTGATFGHILGTSGETISYPNSTIYLRTQPMVIHALNTTITPSFLFSFDCSGGAASATLTIKINNISLRRYGQ